MMERVDNALVLFPGALGDFVCFLPALLALRARHTGPLRVVAQPALLQLLQIHDVSTASIDRREVADLFAADCPLRDETAALFGGFGSVYSWTGSELPHVDARLARLNPGAVQVYRFRGMQPGEHAADYYARCIGARGDVSVASAVKTDEHWLSPFLRRHGCQDGRVLVVHAGSGSLRKNWQGFAKLCAASYERHETTVWLRGPAESERGADGEMNGVGAQGLTLPQVAGLLRHSGGYVGNDSGVSHLAAALGTPALVLFGSSDPTVWAPRGPNVRILHAPENCRRCGPDVFCTHRLPIETVAAALAEL